MKVRDIFTREAKSCRPDTNLAAVGALMWDADCGVIPVTDDDLTVLGVITDRDAYIALATRNRPAGDVLAMEVMRGPATACGLNDDLRGALSKMQEARIRRLPVVDGRGKLEGMLSLDDVALSAKPKNAARPGDVNLEEVAATFRSVCRHATRTQAAKVPEPAAAL